MTEAYPATVERLRDAEAAHSMRRRLEQLTGADAARRPGSCAVRIPQIESFLGGHEADEGEAVMRRFKDEAVASQDPFTGGGCL